MTSENAQSESETHSDGLDTIARLESEVRGYSRAWPAVFTTARGHELTDENGDTYIDFFSAAGSLNYGHNNRDLKLSLFEFISRDPVIQGLDTATPERVDFLNALESLILAPRGLEYVVQFCGPTGTNAVEAAMKLARKVTGRSEIICFTNSYHGLTLGALAATGASSYRGAAGVPLSAVTVMPFDGFLGAGVDSLGYIEAFLDDPASGVDIPAAVIVETVQAEGGVNVATTKWLSGLAELCERHEIMLIIDDIQAGCGRTGTFFSFEDAQIVPDIVCLSKSISGYGMPMAINLIKPELDQWQPGEHTGTFRGFGMALAMATAALERYWSDKELMEHVGRMGRHLGHGLDSLRSDNQNLLSAVRGRGMIQGIECGEPENAGRIAKAAFELGLIVETCGSRGQVVKLLPPLIIDKESLEAGLERLAEAVHNVAHPPVSLAEMGDQIAASYPMTKAEDRDADDPDVVLSTSSMSDDSGDSSDDVVTSIASMSEMAEVNGKSSSPAPTASTEFPPPLPASKTTIDLVAIEASSVDDND